MHLFLNNTHPSNVFPKTTYKIYFIFEIKGGMVGGKR
jgi:hypothetical protein